MNVGKALRTVRAAKGLSQKDVATLASLDPSYVSLIETGRRNPTLNMVETLARALGVPLYLFIVLGSDEQELQGITPEQASILGRQILDVALATQREEGGRGRKRTGVDAKAGEADRPPPKRSARSRRRR